MSMQGGMPPFRNRMDDRTRKRFRVVLLAIIVALLALIPLAWYVWQTMDDDYHPNITVDLREPVMESFRVGSVTYWNMTIVVGMVVPKDTSIPWDEVNIAFRTHTGEPLARISKVRECDNITSPAVFEPGALRAWYMDSGTASIVGLEDVLMISGLSRSHAGTELYVYWEASLAAKETLPSSFP